MQEACPQTCSPPEKIGGVSWTGGKVSISVKRKFIVAQDPVAASESGL